jgi:hypothetical protein
MAEIILVKRKAREGEIGLFLETPVFQEEMDSLPQGVEIKAECTVPSNLKYLKFYWALMTLLCDNTEAFIDKRDASNRVLLEARHYKIVQEPLTGRTEIKPRSVSGLSADAWLRLLARATHVVITQFMPGMSEGLLKDEIARMIGMDIFAKGGANILPSGRAGKPRSAAD